MLFDPTHAEARRLVACCLHAKAGLSKQLQLFGDAAAILRQCLALDPSQPRSIDLQAALAEDLANEGQVDEAMRVIKTAMQAPSAAPGDQAPLFVALALCLRAKRETPDKIFKCF